MDYDTKRAELIKHLAREIGDTRVLEVMSRIPRERFVPRDLAGKAYEDYPLPIGYGQTISQPYIIALMTGALLLEGFEKVLEVGTGSGYQAAILAELVEQVITTERIPELAFLAKKTLDDLGYTNITVVPAMDELGWSAGAPYDAIIVTAAAPRVPDSLVRQLALYGRLVIPVGSRYIQELYRVTKLPEKTRTEKLGGCRFVPLIGQEAWEDNGED